MSGDPDEIRRAVWKAPESELGVSKPRYYPIIAAGLSLFLPGTGQLMNRRWKRAGIVFALWTVGWVTHLSPLWTIMCLYAGIEAGLYAAARKREANATAA